MNTEVNCLLQGCISLPIEPRSIFRLLAIGTVVRYENLIKHLKDHFTTILTGIKRTPRLGSKCDDCASVYANEWYEEARKWDGKDFLNYGTKGHMGGDRGDFEDCGEEELCKSKKAFFTRTFKDSIGTVFDYQVPLNSSQNAGEGVIDLLSFKNNTIYVIEAKKWDSDEHPLRAMFEALTFWRLISDNDSLFPATGNSFVSRYDGSSSKKGCLDKIRNVIHANDITLIPAILVRGGRDGNESGIYRQLLEQQISEPYKSLYEKILEKTGLRCFRYYRYKEINNGEEKLQVEDFTDELKL